MLRSFTRACGVVLAAVCATATAQMATPINFDVGSSGAANINIPIDAPPGIDGLTPNISLTYNSQAQNGLAGVGWNVGGISSVARCAWNAAEHGTPLPRAVRFASDDAYCADGMTLLGGPKGGVWGAPDTQYKSMIDSFRRFTSKGTAGTGPQYFTASTKDGLTLEYGNTTDSRLLANGKSDVAVWMVNRITDRKGNYIKFTYTLSTTTIVPSVVEYGGNSKTGKASTMSIKFGYATADRTDYDQSYQGGSLSEQRDLLTGIKTYVGATLVKEYKLTHTASVPTARNTLTLIQECDGAAKCRPALTNTYSSAANSLTGQTSTGMKDTWASPSMIKVGDFTGDGKADLAVLQEGAIVMHPGSANMAGFWKYPVEGNWGEPETTWVGDFNGDGRADIASADGDKIYMKLADGSSFKSSTWKVENGDWGDAAYTMVGDFNGDGMTDIASPEGGVVHMYISNGKGFGYSRWSVTSAWGGSGYTWVGDFNGDGLSDIASASGSNVYMKLSTGSGFRSETWPITGVWGDGGYTWAADFNGDGLTDIASAVGATVYVRLSKGAGGFISTTWALDTASWGSTGYTRIGDFNADGLTDIVTLIGTNAIVRMSNGHGFRQQTWPLATELGGSDYLWTSDFDGDGRTDIVSGNGDKILSNHPAGGDDRLSKFVDAAGFTTEIAYTTHPQQSVYFDLFQIVKEAGVPVHPNFPIVKRVDFNKGKADASARDYSFGAARHDPGGRGFLGFISRHSMDPVAQLDETTYYRIDFPYQGQVAEQVLYETYQGGGIPSALVRTSYEYSCVLTNIDPVDEESCKKAVGYWTPVWPFPKETLAERFEFRQGQGMVPLPKQRTLISEVDRFGNALVTKAFAQDKDGVNTGFDSVTTDTYDNDEATWVINRLVQRRTNKSAP